MYKSPFKVVYAALVVACTMMAFGAHAAGSPDPHDDPFTAETARHGPQGAAAADFDAIPWPALGVELKLAHEGQLSPKDHCHRHKAASERHWHLEGTTDRGGPCVKVDGETFRFGGNALCPDERVALSRDRDRWNMNWRQHAESLLACIKGLDPGTG